MLVKIVNNVVIILMMFLFSHCGNSNDAKNELPLNDNSNVKSKVLKSKLVELQNIERTINITGRVIALQKFNVISEVQGTILESSKEFKEGVSFKKGETLLSIEDDKFRYNLSALKSQFLRALVTCMPDIQLDYPDEFTNWNSYVECVDVEKQLPKLPEINDEQLKYFLVGKNVFNLYYSIKSQEEILEDYKLIAPYNGVIVESNIDVGDLIRPGMKVGEFIRTDTYEVKAAISSSDLSYLKVGQTISLFATNINKEITAIINRIGKKVDISTQTVSVYLRISDNEIKEGMYLEGEVKIGTYQNALLVNSDLISRDQSVYLIENSRVISKKVDVLKIEHEHTIVSGLNEGDCLVIEKVITPIQGIKAIAKY